MINRTAAEIAAAALFELFPGIQLLGGRDTTLGFSYGFLSSCPLSAEVEVLIEEKMRQIIREKRPIRVLEMVPCSARALLMKDGHPLLADTLPEEGLVDVAQIGSFHSLSSGRLAQNTFEIGAFKLWPTRFLEDGSLQLSGCAFSSKEDLKCFLKKLKHYPEKSHIKIGLKKSLLFVLDGQLIWLEAGLKLQEEVLGVVRKTLFRSALEVRLGEDRERKAAHVAIGLEVKRDELFEFYWESREGWNPDVGLFEGIGGDWIWGSFLASNEKQKEKFTSLLQSIAETLNILGFQYSLLVSGGGGRKRAARTRELLQSVAFLEVKVEEAADELKYPRLDFLVEDALGRRWAAFSVEMEEKSFYLAASVERLVALLVEQKWKTNGNSI